VPLAAPVRLHCDTQKVLVLNPTLALQRPPALRPFTPKALRIKAQRWRAAPTLGIGCANPLLRRRRCVSFRAIRRFRRQSQNPKSTIQTPPLHVHFCKTNFPVRSPAFRRKISRVQPARKSPTRVFRIQIPTPHPRTHFRFSGSSSHHSPPSRRRESLSLTLNF